MKELEEVLQHLTSQEVEGLKRSKDSVLDRLFAEMCELYQAGFISDRELQEYEEEIVILLHCYSMKLYSKRKRKTIEELIK